MDGLGIGNIDILVEVDKVTTSKTLTEVLYVPGLGSNLFSVGEATANGLVATFDDNKVIISFAAFLIKSHKASHFSLSLKGLFKRNGETVLTGEKQNETLFQLHMKPDIQSIHSDTSQICTLVALGANLLASMTTWHQRLGNLGY
jgi:hypothetical protein